jgi:putative transposase
VDINKDVVRRILGKHYRPQSGSGGPSWLTFIGQAKDSLWSIDMFRCESLKLRTHWVLRCTPDAQRDVSAAIMAPSDGAA